MNGRLRVIGKSIEEALAVIFLRSDGFEKGRFVYFAALRRQSKSPSGSSAVEFSCLMIVDFKRWRLWWKTPPSAPFGRIHLPLSGNVINLGL